MQLLPHLAGASAYEPQATHGLPSLPQGFLPCGQTAIQLFLA
jgi:hypothetical protein